MRTRLVVVLLSCFFCWAAELSAQSEAPEGRTAGWTTAGTTDYPHAGMAKIAEMLDGNAEDFSSACVIDTVNGYGYFGTYSGRPGRIVKVKLGKGGATPPPLMTSVVLEPGEEGFASAIIDVENGHAYFFTYSSPTRIVKIGLGEGDSPPFRIGAITLEESQSFYAAHDPVGGYAYVVTNLPASRIVKIRLTPGSEPPQFVCSIDAAALAPDIGDFRGLAIDAERKHLFVSTSAYQIVKLYIADDDLPPTFLSAYVPAQGGETLGRALIDASGGHVYFVGSARFIKFTLGDGIAPPRRVGAVVLQWGRYDSASIYSGIIDSAHGYAYLGTNTRNAVVGSSIAGIFKIGLSGPDGLPYYVGERVYGSFYSGFGSYAFTGAAIDQADGHAYFVRNTTPGMITKVALDEGDVIPREAARIWMHDRVADFHRGTLDPKTGNSYHIAEGDSSPWSGNLYERPRIVRMKQEGEDAFPRQVDAHEPPSGFHWEFQVDPLRGYGYYTANDSATTSRLYKISLGSDSEQMRPVADLPLLPGEAEPKGFLVNSDSGHLYLRVGDKLVKFALGDGDAVPVRVGETEHPTWPSRFGYIAPETGHAYFTSAEEPPAIYKVRLGSGDEAPTFLGVTTVSGHSGTFAPGLILPEKGYGYFPANEKLFKVALGEGDALPAPVGEIDFYTCSRAILHPDRTHAFFGGNWFLKVRLGEGADLPSLVGTFFDMEVHGKDIVSAFPDPVSGDFFVYLSPTDPMDLLASGRIDRLSTDQSNFLKGNRFVLTEAAVVSEMRFYSHAADANLRLALYDDRVPQNLLWESGVIENTAENAEVAVAIEGLTLAPGNYWLAWQTDSRRDVPSSSQGSSSTGFLLRRPFGPAPARLDGDLKTSSDRWTQYIVYNGAQMAGIWAMY